MPTIDCVLFDLDGTLADTTPDLAGALNRVRAEEGLPALPASATRPVTSQGVRGLLRVGFAISPEDAGYAVLSTRLLEHYASEICVETTLFDEIPALLDELDKRGLSWGIVTNKHSRFTIPLVSALGLSQRAACVVSGDTAARPKPAPDPLLHASRTAGVAPARAIYVGDDIRDIEAGRAAGMRTYVAAWGYLGEGGNPSEWRADAILSHPRQLLETFPPLVESPLAL